MYDEKASFIPGIVGPLDRCRDGIREVWYYSRPRGRKIEPSYASLGLSWEIAYTDMLPDVILKRSHAFISLGFLLTKYYRVRLCIIHNSAEWSRTGTCGNPKAPSVQFM